MTELFMWEYDGKTEFGFKCETYEPYDFIVTKAKRLLGVV